MSIRDITISQDQGSDSRVAHYLRGAERGMQNQVITVCAFAYQSRIYLHICPAFKGGTGFLAGKLGDSVMLSFSIPR